MGLAVQCNSVVGSGGSMERQMGGATPAFRAVFEKAAVGLAQVDLLGRFQHVNQAFCDLVGYSLDELTAPDFNWRQLVLPEDIDTARTALDSLRRGDIEGMALSGRCRRKDCSFACATD